MPDGKEGMIYSEVMKCRKSTKLSPDNQMHEFGGQYSAPDPGGPDQSAAVPGGSPGTGYSGKMSYGKSGKMSYGNKMSY